MKNFINLFVTIMLFSIGSYAYASHAFRLTIDNQSNKNAKITVHNKSCIDNSGSFNDKQLRSGHSISNTLEFSMNIFSCNSANASNLTLYVGDSKNKIIITNSNYNDGKPSCSRGAISCQFSYVQTPYVACFRAEGNLSITSKPKDYSCSAVGFTLR